MWDPLFYGLQNKKTIFKYFYQIDPKLVGLISNKTLYFKKF